MLNNLPKKDLAARAAIRYYEYQQGQNEIANALGISRSYVSQLLTYARDIGIVKISVNIENDYRQEMEFLKNYKCKHAYIMKSDSQEFTSDNIGRFAAPHIMRLINNSSVIGVNLGKAVQKVITELDSTDFVDTVNKVVVQMMGGYNSNNTAQASLPNELVSHLSQLMNCRCFYLNCPVIVESEELRDLICQERSIREVIDTWPRIDLALMGIGVANENSKTFRLLSQNMKDRILLGNACCDVNVNFFNQSGQYLEIIDNNKIAMPFVQLKSIKNKVVIGYGKHKAKAISAALKASMIDVLFTDSLTADEIKKYTTEKG